MRIFERFSAWRFLKHLPILQGCKHFLFQTIETCVNTTRMSSMMSSFMCTRGDRGKSYALIHETRRWERDVMFIAVSNESHFPFFRLSGKNQSNLHTSNRWGAGKGASAAHHRYRSSRRSSLFKHQRIWHLTPPRVFSWKRWKTRESRLAKLNKFELILFDNMESLLAKQKIDRLALRDPH